MNIDDEIAAAVAAATADLQSRLEAVTKENERLGNEIAEAHGGPALTHAFRLERNDARARCAQLESEITAANDAWHAQEEELQSLRSRLDAVRSILLDRFGTGEISPLVAVGLIGKELLLTPTHDDVVRAAATVVERHGPISDGMVCCRCGKEVSWSLVAAMLKEPICVDCVGYQPKCVYAGCKATGTVNGYCERHLPPEVITECQETNCSKPVETAGKLFCREHAYLALTF